MRTIIITGCIVFQSAFKVWIDFNADGDWKDTVVNEKTGEGDHTYYYYVEVEIPDGKTVSVETLDNIGESLKYRLDPDERSIQ